MLTFRSARGVRFCDGMHRRDFLHAGGLAAGSVGLSLADLVATRASGRARRDVNCIILFLVGGPSHLDTWDMKPGAPDHVRGPFRPICTNVSGTQICEHFPLMARMADRFAIVRSLHHDASPIHETGHQLMQTGHLFQGGVEYPHYGAVLSQQRGPRNAMPPFVVVPGPIGSTGVNVSHGQGAGFLGERHEPFFPDARAARFMPVGGRLPDENPAACLACDDCNPARPSSRRALISAVDRAQRIVDASSNDAASRHAWNQIFSSNARPAFDLESENHALRERYGRNTFGQSCLLTRRLIEHGVRLVTVNMFDTVFNKVTWDCHADGGALATTLNDYRKTLCPMFDLAYTALLDDLKERGMLESTLVVAMGEFGRTPQLNAHGGRDHWPGAWSILFAGGGVRGGQVIGATDRIGAEVRDRPVSPAQVAATIHHCLGIEVKTRLSLPDHRTMTLCDADPIAELVRA